MMRRTVPERERITTDSVSTWSPTTRTPRISAPLVTPVAAEDVLALDEVVGRQHAVDVEAVLDEPPRSLVVRGQSLPCIAPPRHLMAAAEIASGVPDSPSAGRRPCPPARGDRRGNIPVADQVDARAGLAELGDQVVVALALEHDDGEVVDVDVLALGHALEVLRRGRIDVDRVGRLGPTAILSM